MDQEVADELEYLRWFFQKADFGPADGDVRFMMREQFIQETGKWPPEGYRSDTDYQQMTLKEFEEACRCGAYTDDDGTGYLIDKELKEGPVVSCVQFVATAPIFKSYVGVNWYGK